MQKIYSRINWENFPSEKTAVNESNLNRMDLGLDNLDDRVIALDAAKFNTETANTLIKDWVIDEQTGVITITKLNGEKILFDLNIEKIPVNFTLSDDGVITMTTDDGEQFTANIGAMIPVLTFEDSDTIVVSVSGEGANKTYSFSIKAGSVTEDKLQPNFLADVKTEVAKAQASQSAAAQSASDASSGATLAESYTHGGTGTRDGEDTDNARYYMEQAKAVSAVDIATTEKAGIVKPDGTTITIDEDGTLHGSSSVDEMTGATADKDGTSGTAPAPTAGQESLFLRGDGTWAEAKQDLSAYYNNANYDTENNKLQLMNGDTVLKEIEISGGGGTKIVTFADGTDEEIAKMIQAHYDDKINISDYWAVGDTRSVSLSAMSATGVGESHRAQTVQFVIGDFEHDDLATPINGHSKAAVTLLQKDCLMDASNASNPVNGEHNTENGYMNSTGTNVGGWKSCARRTWCNNVYFSALPSAWQSMVKTVNKKVSVGNRQSTIETVQDKVFLAAEIEIFGSTTYSFAGEGTQYQYYKNATANRYKMPKWNSSSVSNAHWERSPDSGNNSNTFCDVSHTGGAAASGSSYAYGLAPCLCI